MTEHASSHIILDDFRPTNTTEALFYAILLELRALNADQSKDETTRPSPNPPSSTAAPRRDDAAQASISPPSGHPPRATVAHLPVVRKSGK